MESKIYFISDKNGENTLLYCLSLTEDEVRRFCKRCGVEVVDIAEIKQEEIQYYCVDGRVWCDTPEKESVLRKLIA